MADIQKITPFLWFDGRAKQAAEFYTAAFRNSRILNDSRLSSGPTEGVRIVTFELDGQAFTALDGGPMFQFSPAISFVVNCESQDEVDHFWERLSEGGEKEMCGWLKDKFGVSWQVVPVQLGDLMSDPASSTEVMESLLTMQKIDISQLQEAHDGA